MSSGSTTVKRRAAAMLFAAAFACTSFPAVAMASDGGNLNVSGAPASGFSAYRLLTGHSSNGAIDTDAVSIEGNMTDEFWNAFYTMESVRSISADDHAVLFVRAISETKDPYGLALDLERLAEKYDGVPDATLYNGVNYLPQGYYLVSCDSQVPILVLVGDEDVSISPKPSYPVVDKSVFENETQTFGDIADASVSVDVKFKLTGTTPTDLDRFATYPYEFHDSCPPAIQVDPDSVVVEIDGKEVAADAYKVTTSSNEMVVRFDDIIALGAKGDGVIKVTYNAHIVPEMFAAGTDGAIHNIAYVSYPKDPRHPDELTNSHEDDASLITYVIELDKQNNESKLALSGAVFAIRDKATGKVLAKDGTWLDAYKSGDCDFTTDSDGLVEFKGLDAGVYQIVEVSAPSGYKLPEGGIEFEIGSALTGEMTATAVGPMTETASVTSATGVASATVGNETSTNENEKQTDDRQNPFDRDYSSTKATNMPQLGSSVFVLALLGAGIMLVSLSPIVMRRRRNDEVER